MLHMNAWQGLLSYATCWSNGDEASRALAFVRAHPDVSLDLGAFLVSKALGTLCVYKLLRESGTIVVATITTLRKVLSVLLSVAIFGHAVGPVQWAALALVFLHKYVGEYAAAALVERKKPKAA
ncbi:UDP-galactose transmembrane transporter [Aureococcus anophagefferens]|nr:UDP-galactose transmembrane transporter [Aureococcus anophagefferens]